MDVQQCKECGATKPLTEFHKARNRDGREGKCKCCRAKQANRRVERLKRENPELLKSYWRKYEARNTKTTICPVCGMEFSARRRGDPKREPFQIYCSISCKAKAHMPSGSNHPAWVEKIRIRCRTCSKMFDCYPSWVKKDRRQFCSRRCANDWMRTASDYIYGPKWPAQRRKALKRDKETCQHCGSKGLIHVHHRIPYRISKSNALKNLICLCPTCHTTEEARLRASEDRSYEQLRIRTMAYPQPRARKAQEAA